MPEAKTLSVDDLLGPAKPAESAKGGLSVDALLGDEAKPEPSTTAAGLVGSATRGAAPYAVGAGVGGLIGGPPGAAAGLLAMGGTQLVSSVYNTVANVAGWPKMATPQEMSDRLLDFFGTKRPETGLERMAETTAGGVVGGGATTKAAERVAQTTVPGVLKGVLSKMGEKPAMQAVSGGLGGLGAQSAAEMGGGPLTQALAGLGAGMLPGAYKSSAPASLKAARRVEDALATSVKSGETSPEEVVKELQRGRSLGKPMAVADVGGSDVQALTGTMARKPGEPRSIVRSALEERDTAAGDRTRADVARDLGMGPTARRTEQGLRQLQSQEGNPLYEKAFEGGSIAPLERQLTDSWNKASAAEQDAQKAVTSANARLTAARAKQTQTGGDVYSTNAANSDARAAEAELAKAQRGLSSAQKDKEATLEMMRTAQSDAASGKPGAVWNPRVQQFLDDPIVRTGLKRGLEIQRLEALAKGERFDPTEYAIVGTDEAGDPIVGKVPNMRLLNAAKKGLDAAIASERIEGRLSERGRAIDMVRRSLLEELDGINPDYKTARAKWSGDNATIDAVRLGRNINRMTPEEVADAVTGMTPGDKEFLRIGVADNLLERIAKTARGGDESKRIIRDEWSKGQLKSVFPSQDALERFMDSVDAERSMFETKQKATGGSQTQERRMQDSVHAGGAHAVHSVLHALSGNNIAAGLSALRARRSFGLLSDPVVDALTARKLVDPELMPTAGPRGLALDPSGRLASELMPQRSLPIPPLLGIGPLTAVQPQDQR